MDATREWTGRVVAELGLPEDVLGEVLHPVLDLVRDVAHGVDRPSAPLTAFLVGLAAGRSAEPDADGAASARAVAASIERVLGLVAAHRDDAAASGPTA